MDHPVSAEKLWPKDDDISPPLRPTLPIRRLQVTSWLCSLHRTIWVDVMQQVETTVAAALRKAISNSGYTERQNCPGEDCLEIAKARNRLYRVTGGRVPWLGWLRFGMFHHPAWAVGSYSSSSTVGGTHQIQVNKTQSTRKWDALESTKGWKSDSKSGSRARIILPLFCTRIKINWMFSKDL